jgi:Domain of unknown function (DUF1902)
MDQIAECVGEIVIDLSGEPDEGKIDIGALRRVHHRSAGSSSSAWSRKTPRSALVENLPAFVGQPVHALDDVNGLPRLVVRIAYDAEAGVWHAFAHCALDKLHLTAKTLDELLAKLPDTVPKLCRVRLRPRTVPRPRIRR